MTRRRAFTLIELLLVVFILAALAATTSSMIDDAHEQARYDDTRARLTQLRRGIVGSEEPTGPISGYVADVGALPPDVQALIERPPGVEEFEYVSTTTETGGLRMGTGWRGPYVRGAPRNSAGELEYPDGWGTAGGEPNFGWQVTTSTQSIELRSVGPNGTTESAPPVDDQFEVVSRDDHLVELPPDWSLTVTLLPGATPFSGPATLRLITPNGAGGLEAADPALESLEQTLTGVAESKTFVFPGGTWIPQGVHALVVCTPEPRAGGVLVEFRARAALPTTLSRPIRVGP